MYVNEIEIGMKVVRYDGKVCEIICKPDIYGNVNILVDDKNEIEHCRNLTKKSD